MKYKSLKEKTMKKTLSFVLAVLMMLALLTGCGEKKKEAVNINIKLPMLTLTPLNDEECTDTSYFLLKAFEAFAAQYDKYDVSCDVKVFEQTEYEKEFRQSYGTDDAPDLTFGGYFAMSGYIYDGHVIPLDDIITDAMNSDFSESTWEQSKGYNGKTYLLPFYALQNVMGYNKDLMIQCGLEDYTTDKLEIQSWSMDDWDTIMSTLREKLPETKYPMMMYAKNNQGDTHTMVMLRCKGSEFFDKNGMFNLNTKKGIAGLQWFKDNYDKGYYPKDAPEIEINDCFEMFQNGQLVFYIWNTAFQNIDFGCELGFVNFPSASDKGANSNWISGFMAFDNGDEKKIEVVKDFLSYIYSSDEWMDYSTGGLPCSKSVAARYADQIFLGDALSANDVNAVNFTANNPNWSGVRAAFWPHIQALLQGKETAEQAAAGIDRDCNDAINSAGRLLHE